MRATASSQSTGSSHQMLGVLAFASTVGARVVSEALPGALAGIERWIEGARLGAAVLSQMTVVVGVAAAVGLLISTLWSRELPYFYRVYTFPSTAVVLTLVALSIRYPLDPQEARLLGTVAVSLALAASAVSLSSSLRRAAGLVLLATGLAGASQLGAHALAEAQTPALLPHLARPLATLGHIADVGAITVATAWLISRSGRTVRASVVVLAVVSAVLAWGAVQGSSDGAALWQVLASRSLSDMAPTPKPLLSDMGIYWVDACALGFAALLLFRSRTRGVSATAMSLALLVRADPDIPMCALMLVLAALLTALGDPAGKRESTALSGRSTDQERPLESKAGRRAIPETIA